MTHVVPVRIVDAFTDTVFRGNPAAVIFLPVHSVAEARSAEAMQSCAEELHLSETVFLKPYPSLESLKELPPLPIEATSPPEHVCVSFFEIRWFTPKQEVGLCGHATLAAAHALYEIRDEVVDGTATTCDNAGGSVLRCFKQHAFPDGRGESCIFYFYNAFSGWVSVSITKSLESGCCSSTRYTLDFPLRTPQPVARSCMTQDALEPLCRALGISVEDVDDLQLHEGSRKYLLVVKRPVVVESVVCDVRALVACFAADTALGSLGVAPLSVTVSSAAPQQTQRDGDGDASHAWCGHDVVSRHFAPWVGIDEDPVTGAAHVVLVPYWIRRRCLEVADSSTSMVGQSLKCFQASHRGGSLLCTVRPNERLALEGQAVTFLRGTAVLPL